MGAVGGRGVLARRPRRPRLGLRADATSGDRDPRDNTLQTFNPLFPSATAYSGSSGLVGAANAISIAPSLRLTPRRGVTVAVDAALYWRQRSTDGLYTVFVTPLRRSDTSAARRVGLAPVVSVFWQADTHMSWTTAVSRFAPGPFLRESPPSEAVNYLTSFVAYRF